jgi:hypothetical protein
MNERKERTMSKKKLQQAIDATGYDIEIEVSPPPPLWHEGTVSLYIDQDLGLEFAATNGTSCVCPYYPDIKGSIDAAYRSLLKDISCGLEPMSEETKHACGID